jgi:hypothetical protein
MFWYFLCYLVLMVYSRDPNIPHKSPMSWGSIAQTVDGDIIVRAPDFTSSAVPLSRCDLTGSIYTRTHAHTHTHTHTKLDHGIGWLVG